MKKYASIILNFCIIVFGFAGLGYTCFSDGFMKKDAILYYTIQSNIFVMITAVFGIVFEWRKARGKTIPNAVYALRFVSTVDITLTFLVFSLMLTPVFITENNAWYLVSPGNLFVHNLLPLAAIFDWCFFCSSRGFNKRHTLYALIFPLAYCIFMLTRSFLGLTVEGNLVPYFFLDYQKSGWLTIGKNGLGVVYWIVILAFALLGMCAFFKRMGRKR